jgi:hypothetical protein
LTCLFIINGNFRRILSKRQDLFLAERRKIITNY